MKTKNKRNYSKENGITLIALVVTIVVLLILAGVSVNALFGNSGIIKKSQEAQNVMNKAKENDEKEINTLTNWLENQVNGTTEIESKCLTTAEAIMQGLKIGDYVNYPVGYINVGTFVNNSSGEIKGNYPQDNYAGWRVLSIEGEGSETYIRLISAGVPLNYYHYDTSATTVTNLTTNFFSTPISSTLTQYNFYSCGFKNSSGNVITNIVDLKTLFTNKYTQMEGTTPKVQSITKEDLDKVYGSETSNGTSLVENDLLAIPCKSPENGQYATTIFSSPDLTDCVWCVDRSGYVPYDGNCFDAIMRCSPSSFSKN